MCAFANEKYCVSLSVKGKADRRTRRENAHMSNFMYIKKKRVTTKETKKSFPLMF